MVTVHDLITKKGNKVWSISPNDLMMEALVMMAEKNVGALLVMDGNSIAGIISERDFARSIASTGKCLLNNAVENYMTRELYTVGLEQSIEACMQLMTQKHIRHLPVVENGELQGLISIGDVVKAVIASKDVTINHLENFIEGRGYGQ